MKRILPLVLCVMPLSALAATPSEILSKGEILWSSKEGNYSNGIGVLKAGPIIQYDVAYKKKIYRCMTTISFVSCVELEE